jgi:hypothetical protein
MRLRRLSTAVDLGATNDCELRKPDFKCFALTNEIFVAKNTAHSEDLAPWMSRLKIIADRLRRLADGQQPVGRSVLRVGIAKERFTGQSRRLPLDAGDKLKDVQQSVDCDPFFRKRGSRLTQCGDACADGCRCGSSVDTSVKNFSIRSRGATRSNNVKPSGAIKIEEHVDVGSVAGRIARARAENKKAHPRRRYEFPARDASIG